MFYNVSHTCYFYAWCNRELLHPYPLSCYTLVIFKHDVTVNCYSHLLHLRINIKYTIQRPGEQLHQCLNDLIQHVVSVSMCYFRTFTILLPSYICDLFCQSYELFFLCLLDILLHCLRQLIWQCLREFILQRLYDLLRQCLINILLQCFRDSLGQCLLLYQ